MPRPFSVMLELHKEADDQGEEFKIVEGGGGKIIEMPPQGSESA